MADEVKQVIVVNMAVPFPLGRLMAQIAHASMLNIVNRGTWNGDKFSIDADDLALRFWLKDHYTKVVCKAWGKEQMMKIKAEAEKRKLYVALMEEEGFITALAIGPADVKDLSFTDTLALV
jgi:peptidyl-tRNA hydrolase